jgi:Mg2+/Co2+ transporter CorB
MMEIVLLLILVLAIVVSAFCSGIETGFLSVSRGRILHLAREGGKRAKIVQSAISDLGHTMTMILVGNNLANVTFSAVSSALSERLFPGESVKIMLWAIIAALTVLFFCEFMPKLICAARPLSRTLMLAPFWRAFRRIFSPLGAVVQYVIAKLLPKSSPASRMTPEAVLRLLEDRKDGVKLSDFESALIGRMMVIRSKGGEVTVESLLSAIDED